MSGRSLCGAILLRGLILAQSPRSAARGCGCPCSLSFCIASFSERVRTAWRVSLARSLSCTRLRVSPVGQGENADSHDGSASWSESEVVGLGLPGRAAQEWMGCLGEMMAARQQTRTAASLAIWVYYSTGWRRLSSVWGRKVWEFEKIFWRRLGRWRSRGGEGGQNKNSSISNYLNF